MAAVLTYDQAVQAILDAIIVVLPDVDRASLSEDTRLFSLSEDEEPSLALDSLDLLDIVSVVERDHGVLLPDDVSVNELERVSRVARFIAGADA